MIIRVVALDVGVKTIGVAVTDESGLIASPLGTIARKQSIYDDLDKLKLLLEPYLPLTAIVLGWPLTADGSEGKMVELVRGFEKRVALHFPDVPLFREDERFSTDEATQHLARHAGTKRKQKKSGRLDAVAAAVILTRFLESTQGEKVIEDLNHTP